MFILAIKEKEDDGAYAIVDDKSGEKILLIFAEEDDAERYAMMLQDNGHCEEDLIPIEISHELAIKTCKRNNHKYTIVRPDDIVIPPKILNFRKQ
jgi:hypothetical protein